MKKKLPIIILFVLSFIAIIIGVIFLNKNIKITKSDIEILDATYNCQAAREKFYEDNKYVYYFPCVKSKSIYVKLGNDKMLVTTALNEGKVTIDELIKAGLEVYKENK